MRRGILGLGMLRGRVVLLFNLICMSIAILSK